MQIKLNRLLDVPNTGLDDARRRRLLNIILAWVSGFCLLVLFSTLMLQVFEVETGSDAFFEIYLAGSGLFLATIAVYAANRYISGKGASVAFLILWLIIAPLSDLPAEVASGRSLFIFTIPIFISSFLLKPGSSFIVAGVSDLEIICLAALAHQVPNIPAIFGFMMIALVSWLSARSLETALREVVTVNRELDHRVMERTLELSEALVRERYEAGRVQSVLEGIADGVLVLDRTGQIIVANAALEHLSGSAASSLLGKNLFDWLAQAPVNLHDRAALQELMNNPFHQDGEYKARWGQKTLVINAAPVRVSGSEIIGRVAVFHDYTREANVERMKNDFLAMVSHELRTPLNSILGYTDMLHEGLYGQLVDQQTLIVERVAANTHKLLSLVSDLLDQAQIEAGRLSFHNRLFKPGELIETMRGELEGIIQSKNLALFTQISEDLPPSLYGDPQRLSQVLVNLVNNAVKFTEQGKIQVVLCLADQTHWCIEVSDTGAGIPPDAQQIIFDPFRQADVEVTTRRAGIGLGLSIVKHLVQLMQGEILVTSEVGRGSVFTVILPIEVSEMESFAHE